MSNLNRPNKVILHCAATLDGGVWNYDITDIDKWHREQGWERCGYHYVITRAGNIQKGRLEDDEGAHCYGQNHGSLGVCYIGTRKPTEDQVAAMVNLFFYCFYKHKINFSSWYGHNDFSGKECPGFSINLLRVLFKNSVIGELASPSYSGQITTSVENIKNLKSSIY